MQACTPPAGAYRVCAAVVTFHPDRAVLPRVLDAIGPQVDELLVIDNATPGDGLEPALPDPLPGRTTVVRNAGNVGLGAAYNQAARHARASGCTHVLLLDQDSIAAPDMVSTLVAAHERRGRSARVGAVGPRFIDPRTGHGAPFVRIGFPLNRLIHADAGTDVECDFLISSGSLIALDVLDAVGGMDESLFIDSVDLEWCFRARRHGYRLYGVGAATMVHSIGDDVRRLPLGLGEVLVHSPTRLYYMTRNRVALYRRAGTPRVWILQDVPRLVFKFIRFTAFVAPRWRNGRAMASGVLHGWRGQGGKLRNAL